ncbi:GNAT family N-acetyltransferase [Oricola cellulosilytica]|uniref:GNAT family N-acetyltransferase n=1 Tax=Oricola cellulosilytica TaxID=1429082 RepID=A0A4R0PBK5_9HYPH|nr:GNAT family N-acetyltransferase [Oricola cellulosilytica]TCD12327.1 GNAT family N-acetyltransferase [Oricola cellulosilytica]
MTGSMNARSVPLETTVTFLEMTSPPAKRYALPLGVNAVVLRAEKPPLPFYRYLQFHVGYPWNWEQRLRMNDDALARQVHADATEIYVLYLDGAPAGFFEVNRRDRTRPDLAYFGLMPHASGRGLGRWFLGRALEACWSDDATKVTVNTCTLDHPAALPLYQKLGFQPYRQAPGQVTPLAALELQKLAEQGVVQR